MEFWRLLFSQDGFEWATDRVPWLEWWFEFLKAKWKKAVNKDLWKQTLTFAVETVKDDILWTDDFIFDS